MQHVVAGAPEAGLHAQRSPICQVRCGGGQRPMFEAELSGGAERPGLGTCGHVCLARAAHGVGIPLSEYTARSAAPRSTPWGIERHDMRGCAAAAERWMRSCHPGAPSLFRALRGGALWEHQTHPRSPPTCFVSTGRTAPSPRDPRTLSSRRPARLRRRDDAATTPGRTAKRPRCLGPRILTCCRRAVLGSMQCSHHGGRGLCERTSM